MKVKFVPQNVECEIRPNESVLHVAQDNGIHIKSVCKGVPSCAECRVRVTEGAYNVLPPNSAEVGLIGNSYFVDNRRLSCQLRCFGDITIDLTEQIEKENLVSKRPRGRSEYEYVPDESRARQGNIIFEEPVAESAPPPPPAPAQQPKQKNHNHGRRHGGGQHANQNQNQNRQQNKGQQKNSGQKKQPGGKPQPNHPKRGG